MGSILLQYSRRPGRKGAELLQRRSVPRFHSRRWTGLRNDGHSTTKTRPGPIARFSLPVVFNEIKRSTRAIPLRPIRLRLIRGNRPTPLQKTANNHQRRLGDGRPTTLLTTPKLIYELPSIRLSVPTSRIQSLLSPNSTQQPCKSLLSTPFSHLPHRLTTTDLSQTRRLLRYSTLPESHAQQIGNLTRQQSAHLTRQQTSCLTSTPLSSTPHTNIPSTPLTPQGSVKILRETPKGSPAKRCEYGAVERSAAGDD